MADLETSVERKRGPRAALQRRMERRVKDASMLESSAATLALKEQLSERHPDAIITVTKPKGHPLARISVEAMWGIDSEIVDVPTEHGFPKQMTVWTGNRVELTLPKPNTGLFYRGSVMVESRLGKNLLYRDAWDISSRIGLAINNPSGFVLMHEPGSEPHRRRIN